ncbi:MAG: DNA-binding transcriptional LysR family regulator [Gammaproteobacteria bacterium]|jgi:DNA-binding transcriptional LysR family regulator
MTQSAASNALMGLERHYELKLFDRIGKRLQLNDQGKLVRPQAVSLLAQARELELTLLQQLEKGFLQVGAALTIGNYLAVDLIAEYTRLHPDSEIKLQVENTENIAAKVINFELDIGLIEGELNHPELDIIPWQDDELIVFCAPDHALAALGEINDQQLLEAQWVLREKGSGTRQTFDRAMHGLLSQLNITLELQHTEAIKRAVESKLGIGCLSKVALKDAFSKGRLVPLLTVTRDFRRQFYFIIHRQKYRSVSMQRWLDLCVESVAR